MRPKIPLPRAWNRRAKSAILYILALSHYMLALSTTIRRRSWGSRIAVPVQPCNNRLWGVHYLYAASLLAGQEVIFFTRPITKYVAVNDMCGTLQAL